MAYQIISKRQAWNLIHRTYEGSRIVATRTIKLGTPEADSLGVFAGMTREDAHKALLLHRADGKARYHAERRARMAEKARQRELAAHAWLPAALVADFEKERLPTLGGRRDRWLLAKGILARIDKPPYEWHWQPEIFWETFQKKHWSLGYVRRIMRFVNEWGAYYCRRTGKPWTPVSKPMGGAKAKLQRAHFEKRAHKPTTELTPDLIERAQVQLKGPQWNGLRVQFWMGLRKEELTFLCEKPPSPETWHLSQDRRGFQVFHLFQEKLLRKGIEPRLCWKAVPLVEPEQEELISVLESRAFAPVPLGLLQRELGVKFTGRSARKGFSVEMEARGYTRELIDDWLGHIGSSTAARSYRNRRMAMYSPPAVWESRAKKKA